MTEETKQKLKYWIIGLFSGTVVAAPITAFICKNVYEKKMDEAETRGMNAMAAYAIQQQQAETVAHETASQKAETVSQDNSDDINDWNLSIDDDDATEEAKERTEAHERYLDMINKYSGDEVLRPRVISADDFSTQYGTEKSYVNWYEEDNVFEENLNVIDDPYQTFGVVDGHELFKNADLRPDPDICYIRNEKITTDFEISRIHGSYAKMVGGEMPLGETNS